MNMQQLATVDKSDSKIAPWRQINDTIKILSLSIAQISLSLGVGDKSVDVVGRAFETLLSDIENIGNSVNTENSAIANNIEIKCLCDAASEQTRNFIFAFQFYDELSQRLNHVSNGLSALSDLIEDEKRFSNAQAWVVLHEKIKEKYTIQDEAELFDAVMDGMQVDEAVTRLLQGRLNDDHHDNEVELF